MMDMLPQQILKEMEDKTNVEKKVTGGGSVRWVKVFVKGSIGPCGLRLEALNNVCQLLE